MAQDIPWITFTTESSFIKATFMQPITRTVTLLTEGLIHEWFPGKFQKFQT